MFTSLLNDMMKDTDEKTDEEMLWVKSGRVPSTGASVPMELECITFLACGRVYQPGRSPNPILLGSYGGLFS